MTPKQAEAIRAAAEATYRDLFGPASPEQIERVTQVIAPAWRAMRLRRQEKAQADPVRPESTEAA